MSMTEPADTYSMYFVFYGKFILVDETAGEKTATCPAPGTAPAYGTGKELFDRCRHGGLVADSFAEPDHGYAAALLSSDRALPEGSTLIPLRNLFAVNSPVSAHAARALGLLNWRSATRFCSRCGSPLSDDSRETARRCTGCGSVTYPRISPCIIILVSKGEQILLARHVQRNQDMYTCIAGFMETGESVEECAEREVKEETGLTIKNIRYFASQTWPFPEQLMIGLTAEYDSGDIVLQEDELSDARWFSRDDLPMTPPAGSLAWKLIHARTGN